MKIVDVEQGTDEWQKARCGKFTASRVKAIMTKGRGNTPSAVRRNMIMLLALERLTGTVEDTFKSDAMQRGTEMEPEACDAYAFETEQTVQEVGMVIHADWEHVTCSPDRLVGADGLVEIKCPLPPNHMKYLTEGSHASEYKWQLQHQLFVTGRAWVDVVSYHPAFEGLELAIKRVFPDEEMQQELKAEIVKAEIDINAIIKSLETLKKQKAA
ncbi:MAG: exonuclease [Alphaproteobacteria bacterium]|nr:MAG: exonuclease [Alphaproteobacteria bacterium]